jgi:hypothetical protein
MMPYTKWPGGRVIVDSPAIVAILSAAAEQVSGDDFPATDLERA